MLRRLPSSNKHGRSIWGLARNAHKSQHDQRNQLKDQIEMLPTLALLLSCQLLGEVAARGLGLSVPGPVLGLALLIFLLRVAPTLAEHLRPTTGVILANLSLMFVPAGVGVIGNLDVLSKDWLALLVILVVSTLLAMLTAVGTFIGVQYLRKGPTP